MAGSKQAKQTAKAKKALELVLEIFNINPDYARRDREAVLFAYAELEMRGYKWIAAKQEWALVQGGASPFEAQVMDFMTVCEGEDPENALYILVEGLTAAGYEVVHSCVTSNALPPFQSVIHVQVKK